ncbi:MAG: TonB-dependent receptor [Prevotellaceae bacterium]|jgi:outer membrane receptor protein involved in Fe transport|nr:TonB-dependent receptor [Prevotellaceae bacterium]
MPVLYSAQRLCGATILAMLVLTVAAQAAPFDCPPDKPQISGMVNDVTNGKPLEYVSVVLLNNRRMTVTATVTDEKGRFTLTDIPEGTYILKASFVGYTERNIEVAVDGSIGDIRLSPITLATESKRLNEVVVAVEKSMIEHHIDKIVINVADYIGSEGGNVVDILRKIAGITVDNDGNVSLNGQPAAIYIDGRPSNLSKMDLLNMLYFIEASEIDKVEIIQNPSAKYDAAGGNAIINIITKKNTLNGWSGSVQAGGGLYPDVRDLLNGNGGLTINYRNKWLNTSVNAGLRNDRRFSRYEADMEFGDIRQHQYRYGETKNTGQSAKMTTNFFIDSKNIVGFILSGGWNRTEEGTDEEHSFTENYTAGRLTERSTGVDHTDNHLTNYSANANYQHIFKENAHDLLVNIDVMQYRTQPWSRHENRFYNAAGDSMALPRIWQNTAWQHVDVSSAKVDYIRPLGRKATLEAGGKLSQTTTDNSLLYEHWNQSAWQQDEAQSNDFRYRERIGAIYASVGATLSKKWQAKAGLRWENTWSSGDWRLVNGGDTTTGQRYNNLFPTAYIGYTHSMEQSLSLSYAMRIRRPDYGSLNPFRRYANYYTYSEGNPRLRPQYSHTLNVGYRYEKFNANLYLQRATQVISEETTVDTTSQAGYPVTAHTYGNFGQTTFAGLTTSWSNLFPTVWWSFNLYVSGLYVASSSADAYRNNGWFGNLYMENTFYIGKTWRAELTGNAQSLMPYAYYRIAGSYSLSAGLRKTLWNHKASLSLYIDDLFDSQRSHVLTNRNGQRIEIHNTWSSRQIRLSFSYRFRQALKPRERIGDTEEQNRMRN